MIWRLIAVGVIGAILVVGAGRAAERARFGASDEESVRLIERELRERFDASASTLRSLVERVSSSADIVRAGPRDTAATARLFQVLAAALGPEADVTTGVTVYSGPTLAPLAWWGRVFDLPRERLTGPPALLVAPGALGPRLVRVDPLQDRARPNAPRLGVIVVEQQLGEARDRPVMADSFVLASSIAPVTLSAGISADTESTPLTFDIP